MANRETCKRCGEELDPKPMARNQIYCGEECRDEYWNEKRRTGITWGEWCDERYGKMEPLNLDDLGAVWLACAIDTDGTIGIYKEKRPKNRSGYRYFANVAVTNTDERIVEKAADLMGGFVTTKHRRNDNHKPLCRAKVQRRGVRRVLKEVLPHLVVKKKQAKTVLEFCKKIYNAPRRTYGIHEDFEKMYQKMKVLNKRGTAA